MKEQMENMKNKMRALDEKLLKMVDESTIEEIIKVIEDFLRKLQ